MAKRNWFKMKAEADTAEISIIGDIGEGYFDGVGVKEFKREFDQVKDNDEIKLIINSAGGDVFTGTYVHHFALIFGNRTELALAARALRTGVPLIRVVPGDGDWPAEKSLITVQPDTAHVTAFRATLEELSEASLLIHVVDLASPDASGQCQTVEDVLKDLNLADKTRVTALNKIDLLLSKDKNWDEATAINYFSDRSMNETTVLISATKKWGLAKLMELISQAFERT